MPKVPMSAPAGQCLADVRRRDLVYRGLLRALRLSALHHRQLVTRGLAEAEITDRGYRTLPVKGRAAICRHLLDSGELAGVPGFYVRQSATGTWWTLAGPQGLVISVRDAHDRIVALRIRPDEPHGGKYIWLSSRGRRCGTACSAYCHIARPLRPVTDPRIWLTEGELKADIASERLGAIVVSVPGVGSWRLALAVILELAEAGAEVVVAFDSDARTNMHVGACERELVAALHEAGREVYRADWPGEFNGLDDALADGAEVTVRPVSVVVRIFPHHRRRLGPARAVTIGGRGHA